MADPAIALQTPSEPPEQIARWQSHLLPFMMLVLIATAIFGGAANVMQVRQVQAHIEDRHEINLAPVLATLSSAKDLSPSDRFLYARWETLALLEVNSIQSRYHQASIMLMTRVYIVFLAFATGMVLALVGATFILGKLRETESRIDGEGGFGKFAVSSASPGLILALFGTVLMISTILVKTEITVKDQSLYVPDPYEQIAKQPAPTSASAPGGAGPANTAAGAKPITTPAQKSILDSVRERLSEQPKP